MPSRLKMHYWTYKLEWCQWEKEKGGPNFGSNSQCIVKEWHSKLGLRSYFFYSFLVTPSLRLQNHKLLTHFPLLSIPPIGGQRGEFKRERSHVEIRTIYKQKWGKKTNSYRDNINKLKHTKKKSEWTLVKMETGRGIAALVNKTWIWLCRSCNLY